MWEVLVWPFFWLIIIYYFRKPIKSFLESLTSLSNRSEKISCMGVDLRLGSKSDLPVGPQQQSVNKQQQFMKAYQSVVITEEENIIRSQLTDAGFTYKEAVALLIQHLAYRNLLVMFLSVDRIIFPEQIELLKHLNSQSKLSEDSDLMGFYKNWHQKAETGPGKIDNFEYNHFIKFLLGCQLIIQQGNSYRISPQGSDYLGYLIKSGRSI